DAGDLGVGDLLDVRPAGGELGHLVWVDVEPEYAEPGPGERPCEGQPDVPQADNPDPGGLGDDGGGEVPGGRVHGAIPVGVRVRTRTRARVSSRAGPDGRAGGPAL